MENINLQQNSGWVYCLYDPINNLTKIGRTKNIKQRLINWSRVHATHLMFIAAWEVINYGKIEKTIHRLLKNYKFDTEWFVVSPSLVIEIIYLIDERDGIIIKTKIPKFVDILTDVAKAEIQHRKIKLSKKGIAPIICHKAKMREGINFINIDEIAKKVARNGMKALHRVLSEAN